VAAGAANADAVGNPANPSAPSAIPSRRMRRRLMCDATMVQVLPYGHVDLLAADCSIRTAKLKAVGSAGAFAACGCGRLPNGPGHQAKIGLDAHRTGRCRAATHWREITGCERRFAPAN
jgi:hypothetical protein